MPKWHLYLAIFNRWAFYRAAKKKHKYLKKKGLCKFQDFVRLTVRIRDRLKWFRGVKDQLARCTVSWPLNRLHVWPLIHCR